jgi:hypothetical protein
LVKVIFASRNLLGKLNLSLAKEKQDKEKTIEMIISLVNEAASMVNGMKSKLYSHRKCKVTNSWSKERIRKLSKRDN